MKKLTLKLIRLLRTDHVQDVIQEYPMHENLINELFQLQLSKQFEKSNNALYIALVNNEISKKDFPINHDFRSIKVHGRLTRIFNY